MKFATMMCNVGKALSRGRTWDKNEERNIVRKTRDTSRIINAELKFRQEPVLRAIDMHQRAMERREEDMDEEE